MYYSDDKNICQHLCGGIEKYLETCNHYLLYNNLKNLNSETPLHITIQGTHHPSQHMFNNIIPKISQINLTYSIRNSITLSRRVDHRIAKEIKAKLLTLFNGVSEKIISKTLANQCEICDNDKFQRLIIRDDRKFKDNTGL
ncbi:7662_t:CDS:2 [Funneliformis caledonium]|uniref:7662_t:CDS:1 n=1 Tax=Funneliformis caledonium TaxID=1117310 RepID=A0A9N9ARB3_9GLOM|nr:7662_t:CDS:2 [Funneliformis caledonium]